MASQVCSVLVFVINRIEARGLVIRLIGVVDPLILGVSAACPAAMRANSALLVTKNAYLVLHVVVLTVPWSITVRLVAFLCLVGTLFITLMVQICRPITVSPQGGWRLGHVGAGFLDGG